MNPAQQLQRAGLSLTLTPGGQLLVKPKALITDDVRAFVSMHRAQIVASLLPAANDGDVHGNLGNGFSVGATGGARPVPPPAQAVPLETPTSAATPAPMPPPAPARKPQTLHGSAHHQEWAAADRAYQAHHFACGQCIAAGRGYGQRCPEGLTLLEGAQC